MTFVRIGKTACNIAITTRTSIHLCTFRIRYIDIRLLTKKKKKRIINNFFLNSKSAFLLKKSKSWYRLPWQHIVNILNRYKNNRYSYGVKYFVKRFAKSQINLQILFVKMIIVRQNNDARYGKYKRYYFNRYAVQY